MKKLFAILLSACAALTTSACGQKTDETVVGNVPSSTAATKGAKTVVSGRGTGLVTAVDPVGGKVTIRHGPIAKAGWPAMTMSFEADPAILKDIALGDEVQFDMSMADGPAKVTAINPQ